MTTPEEFNSAIEKDKSVEPDYKAMAEFAVSDKNTDSKHLETIKASANELEGTPKSELKDRLLASEKNIKEAFLRIFGTASGSGHIESANRLGDNLQKIEGQIQQSDEAWLQSAVRNPEIPLDEAGLSGQEDLANGLLVASKLMQEALETPDGKSTFVHSELDAHRNPEGKIVSTIKEQEAINLFKALQILTLAEMTPTEDWRGKGDIESGIAGIEKASESTLPFPAEEVANLKPTEMLKVALPMDCILVIQKNITGTQESIMMWIESTRSADERLATRNNSKANTDLQSYNSLPDADPRKKIIAQQYPNSIMWNAEDITEEGKGVDPKALL